MEKSRYYEAILEELKGYKISRVTVSNETFNFLVEHGVIAMKTHLELSEEDGLRTLTDGFGVYTVKEPINDLKEIIVDFDNDLIEGANWLASGELSCGASIMIGVSV